MHNISYVGTTTIHTYHPILYQSVYRGSICVCELTVGVRTQWHGDTRDFPFFYSLQKFQISNLATCLKFEKSPWFLWHGNLEWIYYILEVEFRLYIPWIAKDKSPIGGSHPESRFGQPALHDARLVDGRRDAFAMIHSGDFVTRCDGSKRQVEWNVNFANGQRAHQYGSPGVGWWWKILSSAIGIQLNARNWPPGHSKKQQHDQPMIRTDTIALCGCAYQRWGKLRRRKNESMCSPPRLNTL
jgi:hypothetical protein